jgi:hypothetical protein
LSTTCQGKFPLRWCTVTPRVVAEQLCQLVRSERRIVYHRGFQDVDRGFAQLVSASAPAAAAGAREGPLSYIPLDGIEGGA